MQAFEGILSLPQVILWPHDLDLLHNTDVISGTSMTRDF